MSKFGELKSLPYGKSVVFYSPLEGDKNLVRTGTIGDGSCGIHSIFQACSKDYIEGNTQQKIMIVNEFRKNLGNYITVDMWKNLNDGIISKVSFQEKTHIIIENFFKFIKIKKQNNTVSHPFFDAIIEDKLELYNIVCELLPFDTAFEQSILPKAYEKNDTDYINNITYEIAKTLDKHPLLEEQPKKKVDVIIKNSVTLFKKLLEQSENEAYQSYINEISSNQHLDGVTLSIIGDKLERDIYFIDAKTRMPYNNMNTFKNRKSIVILWIDDQHYEVVGYLGAGGNRIYREFDSNDIFIKKIKTFLTNPEKVLEKYPELEPYLPNNYRTKKNNTKSKNCNISDSNESDSDDTSDSETDTETNSDSEDTDVSRD